jgi:hypothetical protein
VLRLEISRAIRNREAQVEDDPRFISGRLNFGVAFAQIANRADIQTPQN